jgi:hypothetical protein
MTHSSTCPGSLVANVSMPSEGIDRKSWMWRHRPQEEHIHAHAEDCVECRTGQNHEGVAVRYAFMPGQ